MEIQEDPYCSACEEKGETSHHFLRNAAIIWELGLDTSLLGAYPMQPE